MSRTAAPRRTSPRSAPAPEPPPELPHELPRELPHELPHELAEAPVPAPVEPVEPLPTEPEAGEAVLPPGTVVAANGKQARTQRPPSHEAGSPLMKQYLEIKEQHPRDVLLFRMGDFYEMFYEDAEIVSKALGIVMTARGTGKLEGESKSGPDSYAMAGFPHHAIDRYLPRLIAQGYSVAICEQAEDPALARGKRVVRREVIEVLTPGTLTDEKLLEARRGNFLLCLALARGKRSVGLAWFEAASGRLLVAEVERERLEAELERIGPAELLVGEGLLRAAERDPAGDEARLVADLRRRAPLAEAPDWTLRPEGALEALKERFGVGTLQGLGLEDRAPYVPAAHAALCYVGEKKPGVLEQLRRLGRTIERWQPDEHLCLDPATARCLELVTPLRETSGPRATLLGALDRTRTAMGARLLREWLLAPLRSPVRIEARQAAIGALVAAPEPLLALGQALGQLYDLERLTTRVASGRAGPRDLAALRDSLGLLPRVREAALAALAALAAGGSEGPKLLRECVRLLDTVTTGAALAALDARLRAALVERPAPAPRDGPVIADGFSPELDRLRAASGDVTSTLQRFQEREAERTGIPSLKLGYNSVTGYYIEVTQAQRKKVPQEWIRRQTLKHCERFVTPELKELEAQVLGAADRSQELENQLFAGLREEAAAQAPALLAAAEAAARLDVLASLATIARERGWIAPRLRAEPVLDLRGGRHPVLELRESAGRFVPNDVRLGGEAGVVHVITGPNMAGKSTYIRQAALLVLLAQTGSFVPAEAAEVGVVDRIFARVGAGDELASGLSTFMVEMTETANILRHATERSLVILDEVGRGTSTYDGVSLAWAIAEHLHDKLQARTLFATHYHELTGLPALRAGVRNLNVAVEERGDEVIFLHRVVPGSADRSYGIHVARLAGIPARVLSRAQVILRQLEDGTFDAGGAIREAERPREEPPPSAQRSLFPRTLAEDALRARLAGVDPLRTTPMEALALLEELKRLAEVH